MGWIQGFMGGAMVPGCPHWLQNGKCPPHPPWPLSKPTAIPPFPADQVSPLDSAGDLIACFPLSYHLTPRQPTSSASTRGRHLGLALTIFCPPADKRGRVFGFVALDLSSRYRGINGPATIPRTATTVAWCWGVLHQASLVHPIYSGQETTLLRTTPSSYLPPLPISPICPPSLVAPSFCNTTPQSINHLHSCASNCAAGPRPPPHRQQAASLRLHSTAAHASLHNTTHAPFCRSRAIVDFCCLRTRHPHADSPSPSLPSPPSRSLHQTPSAGTRREFASAQIEIHPP